MDREVARHVIRASYRGFREICDLLPLLKDQCDEAEYTALAKIIATIGADMQLKLNQHFYDRFPGLREEVHGTVDKYGVLL